MEEQKYILDGSKVLWHQERLKEWNYGNGKVAPITIDCALTTKCSYRCVYCYGKMHVSISLIIWIKKLFLIFWMMRQK